MFAPLDKAAGRVCFAGDHRSHTDARQHGAFTSARKAVTELRCRVPARAPARTGARDGA